ncbi:hypothetical protein SRB5_31070 [Streptomyces sp. RB5]|uniref:Uncharacterized protein n=1 Tax=Streptomyces smaragdinus TaxID=2585196 RepID=A0A7K0CHK8_9ACTN|nr:hypothetical protein [Streptomyces smaragdinus]MQY12967.1 hypothetical protein [Streptomyces smaragdinus]
MADEKEPVYGTDDHYIPAPPAEEEPTKESIAPTVKPDDDGDIKPLDHYIP